MTRIQTLATALVLLAVTTRCIIAPRNNATTQDVIKPSTDPPVPESRLVKVEYEVSGLSEPVYESPVDQIFVIRDLRLTEACDVMVELAGVPATLQLPAYMFESTVGSGPRFRFTSPAGLKLPGGAKLRLRPAAGTQQVPVMVFIAGELVRTQG